MSNERIERLEERIAWLERHVGEQDKVMLELAETNARLKAQLIALHGRVSSIPANEDRVGNGVLPEERPPHY